MAMPKVLDWLDDLVAQVATNVTNIEKNAKDIATNKGLFDTHTKDDDRHWTDEDRVNFDRTIHFKGYFISVDKLKEAYATAQLGDYAIVGGSDTVWLWDDETNAWINSTEQGVVISVNGKTGEIALTKADVGLGNVDNTSDANKPISTAQQTALNLKSDRGLITAAQADGHDLRAGLYYLNEEYAVLNDSTMYWAIIVTEAFRKDGTEAPMSSAQIWINFQTGADSSSKIYYRKSEFDYDKNDFCWGEFKEILSDAHLAVVTNNITELQAGVKTNASDIDKLEIEKADRLDTSIANLETFNLPSGIYYTNGEAKEILGFSANVWAVIVTGSTVGKTSQNQIWVNVDTNSVQHMYTRRQQTSSDGTMSWSEFTEIITSNIITSEQIELTKHFKGYFATVNNLIDEGNGVSGDYAIVGETQGIYIWDEAEQTWIPITSSGTVDPDSSVASVNGMTGNVVLTKSSIGLPSVDNTADQDKPISTAMQEALDEKINKDGDTMLGKLILADAGLYSSNTTGGYFDQYMNLHPQDTTSTTSNWVMYANDGTEIITTNWETKSMVKNGYTKINGQLVAGNTQDSTDTTTGAAVIDGGMGVSKSINAGTVIAAGTDLKTGSGKINCNDKAYIQYNATDECIEFIFN